jgi:tetratricopeptide (TPR) repeat protein
MGLFGRFLKRDEAQTNADLPAKRPMETLPTGTMLTRPAERLNESQLRTTPEQVKVHDEFGRELWMPIASWRELLEASLAKAKDDPDKLYGLILDALQLKMAQEVVGASARLYEIDSNPERGACIRGIVLTESGDPAAAEVVLNKYLQEHGAAGVILTNLAKAQVALGREDEASATLWQAIEADPNQENGLGWYSAREKELHGDAAYLKALQRVAALPDSWRAEAWLARELLKEGKLAPAVGLYAEALARAGRPSPTVLLQSISGDLGKQGYLEQALGMTSQFYDPKVHGVAVGNNLIKAALDLGRTAEAKRMLLELQELARPDWAETLNYWESQIRAKELERKTPIKDPKLFAFWIDGPVWLPAQNAARKLFEVEEKRRAKIVFLGSTVSVADGAADHEYFKGQLPDAAGRLSRSVPLLLAEETYVQVGLEVASLLLWVEGGGFAVTGGPWSTADAAKYARDAGAAAAVVTHLQHTATGAALSLRIVRAEEGQGDEPPFVMPMTFAHAGEAVSGLWFKLQADLGKMFGMPAKRFRVDRYVIPYGAEMGDYLLRLEQLLAVRCAGMEDAPAEFLSGEREIVQGEISLAASSPQSLPVRLMLHETLLRLKKLRPQVVAEVEGQVKLLQERYPLKDEEVNAVLAGQLVEIYPTLSETDSQNT